MGKYLTDAMQDPQELADFCALVKSEGVRSFLEIGAKFGGTTWAVGQAMREAGVEDGFIATVDLPGGTRAWKESGPSLTACHAALRDQGFRTCEIWGNSQDVRTFRHLKEIGPFDLVLIDGDHRLEGATKDWEAYGPLARMVAFHDVAWMRAATWEGVRIDVPLLWNHLRPRYRSIEFRHDESFKNNGIGVLWRS